MSNNSISKHYNSIYELPTQVTSALDETDQKKWMDEYNRAVEDKNTKEAVKDAKKQAWMSVVDAPSSLAVETWASVEVKDADGELVPIKTITDNIERFIDNSGLMHDSHSNIPVGSVWGWEERKHPETGQDGIVVYFNINRGGEVFERARDDILSGRKRAVSIGAEAPVGGYKCDDKGCYVERDVTDLYEISICETPANPEAYFIAVGKDIQKSKVKMENEILRLHITDVTVHQDYTTCPLQKMKHDLVAKGFTDVHIKDDLVIAKAVNENELYDAIADTSIPFRYNISKQQFEIMPEYTLERAREEALSNGWTCEDAIGHTLLTKNIPKEVFIDWYERGFIVKIGELWCMKADDVAKGGVTKSRYQKPNGEQLYEMLSSRIMPNDGPWMAFCETLTEMTNEAMQRFNLDPSYEEIVRNFFYDVPGDTIYHDAQDLQYAIDSRLGKSAKKKVKKDGGSMGVGTAGATNAVYGSKPASLVTPNDKNGKKKKKISKAGRSVTHEDIQSYFQSVGRNRGNLDDFSRYFSDTYGELPDASQMSDIFRQTDGPASDRDWWLDYNGYEFRLRRSVSKSNSISKRCPNGYHNVNGQCVDANGNVYQGKQQEQKQPSKTQSTGSPTKYDQVKDIFSDAVESADKKGIHISNDAKAILNLISAGNLKEAQHKMTGLYLDHPKELKEIYNKVRAIIGAESGKPKSSEKPKTTEKPKKKEEKDPLQEDYPKIKGKGRINYDDDLVMVYRNGKLEYKGEQDYNPYKYDDWKYNKTYDRYEIINGKDKVLIVKVG